MARQTKEEKRIEALVDASFRKHSNGNPINIFNIGKVLTAGREAAKAGQDIDAAVSEAFEKYRERD